MGRAYAFFNCYETKSEIERELPTIRRSTRTPNDLELLLTEYILQVPDDLLPIAKKAMNDGSNYLLQARHPTAKNETTANYLADILNHAYKSPLYQEGEPFAGGIVYKGEDGEYHFRE